MERLVFILLGLWFAASQAQNITRIEYFLDTDPGYGNGVSLSLTPASQIITTFDIPVSGISPGLHFLYLRAKNSNDVWSETNVSPVVICDYGTPPDLAQMEYFIDNDPGYGSGTQIPVNPGSGIIKTFTVDLNGISPGIHILYMRVKNSAGRWSLVQQSPLMAVDPSIFDIVSLEYFFDTDPGFGSGKQVPVSAGQLVEKTFAMDITGLQNGRHFVLVRAQNVKNDWSIVVYQEFTLIRTRLFLEGLYIQGTSSMAQAQDEYGNHWGTGIADHVTLQLRNATSPYAVAYQQELQLGTDGMAGILLNQQHFGQQYIAIRHRNSIETWSAGPIDFLALTPVYDFTAAPTMAFGDNQKTNGDGTFSIWGGDVNQDGIVDGGDMNPVDNLATAITFGYVPEDVNGDGIVDGGDMNIVDNNSTAIIMALTP